MLQNGFADKVEPEHVGHFVDGAVKYVMAAAADAVIELEDTKQLTAVVEKKFVDALQAYSAAQAQS